MRASPGRGDHQGGCAGPASPPAACRQGRPLAVRRLDALRRQATDLNAGGGGDSAHGTRGHSRRDPTLDPRAASRRLLSARQGHATVHRARTGGPDRRRAAQGATSTDRARGGRGGPRRTRLPRCGARGLGRRRFRSGRRASSPGDEARLPLRASVR